MQTPTLSPTQRAYMNDPQGFALRMKQRAEDLFFDGYRVAPSAFAHLFLVTTPKGEQYTVAPLSNGCTCTYQQKADVPQVPCKHLQGLSELVAALLTMYRTMAEQHELSGHPRHAADRWEVYRELETFWQAMLDEAQCRQQDTEEDARHLQTACHLSAELNRLGAAY